MARGRDSKYHPRVFIVLSKVLDLLVAPLTWALLLLAAALAFRRSARLASSLVGAAAAVLLAFSAEPVAAGLMRHVEASATRTFRDGVTYDAVIVLGGMTEPSAARTVELNAAADRIVRGFELLRSGRARSVLLSAGALHPAPDEPTEAEQLMAKLEEWGIGADRIATETRSRNTRENAVESARIVRERGWRTLLLVTSAAHMERALGSFRAVGILPDTLPVDFRGAVHEPSWLPRAAALEKSTDALRELLGRAVYRWARYSR